MLRCLHCGKEYIENFNIQTCNVDHGDWPFNTNLYSTSIKNFSFETTPLEKESKYLYLKREDKNLTTRNFKDRKSFFVLGKRSKFALASSGNQAISLAENNLKYFGKDLDAYLYVSPSINTEKLFRLKKLYSKINFTDRILTADEILQHEVTLRCNVTSGMDPLGASAYYSLAMELEAENFDYILVPCGSGELYSALSCYFHLLRKRPIHPFIIPVQSELSETDAITTKFVASQPFIDYFAKEHAQYPFFLLNKTETLKSLQAYSDKYNCELSSAVVFEAYEKLKLKGKTCLVVTGGKK